MRLFFKSDIDPRKLSVSVLGDASGEARACRSCWGPESFGLGASRGIAIAGDSM
jgi:hypothetical protein